MNENVLSLLPALVRVGRLAEARVDSVLEPLSLSATRLWTLQRLNAADRPLSLGDLASCMAFAKSNATQLVDSLETAELVRRAPSRNDRRCTLVELTETGDQQSALGNAALEPLTQRLSETFSPEEREQLAVLLQKLAGALK